MERLPLPGPVLAVDLGASKVAAAVAFPDGRLGPRRQEPTSRAGPDAVLVQIARLAADAAAAAGVAPGRLAGLAVACPGPVDAAAGLVVYPPNLPGWDVVPLRDLLAARLGLPTRIANDADCAALGEWAFGAGRGCRHMLYVTVSSGVGGGLVLDGRLWTGTGTAGEVGHVPVDPAGPPCGCGRRGCLEALASGTAIARRYAERTGAPPPEPPDARPVFAAARAGDPAARAVIEEAGTALGRVLGGVANLLAPERIVLGGGVALGGDDLLLPPLERALEATAFALPRRRLAVRLATLGGDAGLLGAALLFAGSPPA